LPRWISVICGLLLAVAAITIGTAGTANAQPAARQQPGPSPAAATAGRVSGSRSALVITVELAADSNGTPHTVPDKSPAQVAADVITATRPWFQQVSHGVFDGYYALGAGPVTVDPNTDKGPCTPEWLAEIGDQADKAVPTKEPSLHPEQFDAVVYYFGNVPACGSAGHPDGAAGWGNTPDQGKRVWLNGYDDIRVATHELGHNLGLNHSGSEHCVGPEPYEIPVPLSPFSSACTPVEYGDMFSNMGDQFTDGFSPAQLTQLGWNDGRVTTVPAGTSTTHLVMTATEINTTSGTQAVRWIDHSSTWGDQTFWLEYRLPATQTIISGTESATSGLLIRHEERSTTGPKGSPFLLFMNQPDSHNGVFVVDHPNMFVGQTWADPRGTMQITLSSANATTAQVTIGPQPQPQVPNIAFRTEADAQTMITAAGLVTGTISTEQDLVCDDTGKVIRQSPTAGTHLLRGGHVNFTVATPGPSCPVAE